MDNLPAILEKKGIKTLPDTDRYKCRFTVKSESSNNIYMISFDVASGAGYWTCSCRGNIAYGQCKHLTALGFHGRKFGRDAKTIAQLKARGQI